MNFRFVGHRFTAETVNSGDGGLDIVHLETYVAMPSRSGSPFSPGWNFKIAILR